MAKIKRKKNTGRPSKYKQEYVEQAYNFALLGLTDIQISGIFGVDEKTLNNWKKRHKEFFQSLKEGKEIADAKVASSLYKRACGYDYKEEAVAKDIGVVELRKHLPPDTGACMAWLNNRQPNLWRSKREVINTNVNIETDIDELTKIAESEGISVDELAEREGFDLEDL